MARLAKANLVSAEIIGARLVADDLSGVQLPGGAGYLDIVMSTGPLALWVMGESSGATALDATNRYHGLYTGVNLNNPGLFGRTCPYFDGTNDYNNIYSGGNLIASNNWQEFTVTVWAKVSAVGVHTDATARRIIQLTSDANNVINIRRTTTNNLCNAQYIAGGTNKSVNITVTTANWFFIAVTGSKSADQLKGYLDGVQQGATTTGLGTWNGDNSLANIQNVIGANTITPTNAWSGWIQWVGMWRRALSASEIMKLYTG